MELDIRKKALVKWLSQTEAKGASLLPLKNDASFRRYFRIAKGNKTYIAVDAPPAKENCAAFVRIAKALLDKGLLTPEIMAANIKDGFLLLSDFGDLTYLNALSIGNADFLYQRALDVLLDLQAMPAVPDLILPHFNKEFMWREWSWHKEWFLGKFLGLSQTSIEKQLDDCMDYISELILKQPQVFVHRDFHSQNLMVLTDYQVGILDFQDAFIGPVTYDVISLLRDCYINWPKEKVRKWSLYYWEKLQHRQTCINSVQDYLNGLDGMGLQRHLKALMTFARKAIRDQQSSYLVHIPRTLEYVLEEAQSFKETKILYEYYMNTVKPTFLRVASECAG